MIEVSRNNIADILPKIKYGFKISIAVDFPLRLDVNGAIYTKISKESTAMDGMPCCCYQATDEAGEKIWLRADGDWIFD